MSDDVSPARAAAIDVLRLEALAVEAVEALRGEGIAPILLKGPVIARWLYGDGSSRTFGDIDLLLDPETCEAAGQRLRAIGFTPGQRGWRDVSRSWTRSGDGASLDIHRSLFGLYADPSVVWRMLSADMAQIEIGGARIEVLGVPARAAHVATHAAQHGYEAATRPIEDLERALDQLDRATWASALAIARQVDGEDAFGAGLRMCGRGRLLADDLGLPATSSLTVHLHSSGADPLVLGVESLASAKGIGARVRFALRKLSPRPGEMRAHSGLARRGVGGLSLAYLVRPIWLATKLPGAIVAWRRAKVELERAQSS